MYWWLCLISHEPENGGLSRESSKMVDNFTQCQRGPCDLNLETWLRKSSPLNWRLGRVVRLLRLFYHNCKHLREWEDIMVKWDEKQFSAWHCNERATPPGQYPAIAHIQLGYTPATFPQRKPTRIKNIVKIPRVPPLSLSGTIAEISLHIVYRLLTI